MKSLASKLNNRTQLWKYEKPASKVGKKKVPTLVKNPLWADIIPLSGSTSKGQADNEQNTTKFKISIRKTNLVKSDMWIMYKDQRYDIKYILPDFNSNKFLELYCELEIE